MTNAQALEQLVQEHEQMFGKTSVSLQLRFALSSFKGYNHYRPTKENFSKFFQKTLDKLPKVWYNKYRK
jgi:hypothetical protein